MTNVLFVCLGNICRSAMADAIFRRLIRQNHLQDKYNVDSAGTSDEETGNLPHPEVRKVMTKHNLNYDYLRARKINEKDYHWADYIIGMDKQNVEDLKANAPMGCANKVHLCLNILPNHKNQPIPDPWYSRRFNYTYDTLEKAMPAWLKYMEKHEK